MSDSVKDKPSRAEKTRLTRRRIVAAAADLFLDKGYGATTLDQVAARAGVAVQTVYFHFGTRRRCSRKRSMWRRRDDEPVALLDRPWLEELTAEPDPGRVIELWTNSSREILERVAPLLAVVRGTVGTDPDLAAQWNVNEGQRRTAFRALADCSPTALRSARGSPSRTPADLAFLITSAENYIVARNTLGWAPERWQRTTATLLRPRPARRDARARARDTS